MTRGGTLVSRWKLPDDFKRWLALRFDRLVAAELREPGTVVDAFPITTPELNPGAIAKHFAAVRAWASAWTELDSTQPDLEITWSDWDTRNFGRIRIPRAVRALSADGAARSIGRLRDLTAARHRFHSILAADTRLSGIAHQWPRFTAMAESDFRVLCRFFSQTAAQGIARVRLRELPCAGMHTKFLEQHRALLVPAVAALNIPPNPDAKTWAGKLGFIEDETQQFELRDRDGHLLPYSHFSLPIEQLGTNPVGQSASSTLSGVVVVENQATFRSLPTTAGVLAIFGRGNAVRTLGRASWLKTRPLLYAGDLDHAGFLMVAALPLACQI
jgi:hypothetical protein